MTSGELAERIWKAIKADVIPKRIWPDPTHEIEAKIARVIDAHILGSSR